MSKEVVVVPLTLAIRTSLTRINPLDDNHDLESKFDWYSLRRRKRKITRPNSLHTSSINNIALLVKGGYRI